MRPMDAGAYAGQTAIVTGAASGIGRAIALRLAAGGAAVAVLDMNLDGGLETVARIEAAGGKAMAVRVDVSSGADVAAAVAKVVSEMGTPSILVNDAAVARNAPIVDLAEEDFDKVQSVNLRGVFLCLKHTLPHMIQQGYGRVINISSGSGVRVSANSGAYGSSKAGVIALTKAAAHETATRGVTVNVVAPGITDTPMTRGAMGTREDLEERARTGPIANPMGAVLTPEDIAAAVAFFALPETRYVTGQTLHVNAGSFMP